MRICVVGCGAMGSIYAALLSSAGHEVSVIDANAEHVDAINNQGLRVWGASGDRTVSVPAYVSSPQLQPEQQPDLLICAVKAKFVPAAAQTLATMLGPHTRVLTIQNGLGSADIVAGYVGSDRLIVGIAQGFGASLTAPACAHHNAMRAIRMGAYAGLDSAAVAAVADIWSDAGFDADAIPDIAGVQWGKLICNVAYSAPCAITGFTVGEVMQHPQMSIISRSAAREAFDVAQRLGITLSFQDVDREIDDFASGMPDAKPSVLLDVLAGRSSEVDVINGAVPQQAKKVGLEAPVNAALTSLVQALEANAAS